MTAKAPRFAGVGAIGFAVDAGLFFALTLALGAPAVAAKAGATSVAVVVTWALNRTLTFRTAGQGGRGAEFLRYGAASLAGALSNLAAFVLVAPFDAALLHAPAYVVGAAVGLVVNYTLCDRIVFRREAADGR
ncbi:MAG: GtrA family protein [Rhodospirillales bacterium]|jgi:putative flippase GtrA